MERKWFIVFLAIAAISVGAWLVWSDTGPEKTGPLPLYPGAKDLRGDLPEDLEEFYKQGEQSGVLIKSYEVSTNMNDVLEWYRDKMQDWEKLGDNMSTITVQGENHKFGHLSFTRDNNEFASINATNYKGDTIFQLWYFKL